MSKKNNSPESTYNYIERGWMGPTTKEIQDTISRIDRLILKLNIPMGDKELRVLYGIFWTQDEFVEFLDSLECKNLALFNSRKNTNVASSSESMITEEDLLRMLNKKTSQIVFEKIKNKTFLNLLESLKVPQITKYEEHPIAYKIFIILNILYDIWLWRNILLFKKEYQDIVRFLR